MAKIIIGQRHSLVKLSTSRAGTWTIRRGISSIWICSKTSHQAAVGLQGVGSTASCRYTHTVNNALKHTEWALIGAVYSRYTVHETYLLSKVQSCQTFHKWCRYLDDLERNLLHLDLLQNLAPSCRWTSGCGFYGQL